MWLLGSCKSLLRSLASVMVNSVMRLSLAKFAACKSEISENTKPQNSRNLANTLACVGKGRMADTAVGVEEEVVVVEEEEVEEEEEVLFDALGEEGEGEAGGAAGGFAYSGMLAGEKVDSTPVANV
jgi:hypothetical protein